MKTVLFSYRDYDASALNRDCRLAMLDLGRHCPGTLRIGCFEGRASLAGSEDQNLAIDHKAAAPLADNRFSIAVDRVVPAEIELQPLPSEAKELAPQVRGFGYVVVNEEIALVDQRTRKVVLVFQRWREQ